MSRFRSAFKSPVQAGLALMALSFVASVLVMTVLGKPQPYAADEFCYLHAAKTFASGKLTAPAHPQWKHFETVHLLSQPTRQAKYPPMQGACLAVGELFFGDAIWGLYLTNAIMCGVIYWMLLGWVPLF